MALSMASLLDESQLEASSNSHKTFSTSSLTLKQNKLGCLSPVSLYCKLFTVVFVAVELEYLPLPPYS
jgi:hypothetical protein